MIKIHHLDTTYLLGNPPNFAGLPTTVREKYDRGEYTEIPDSPPAAQPDWEGLLNRLISGDLYSLFRSITNTAFSNPMLLVARNDIYGVLSNPLISDRISALKAGLDMLAASGYAISDSDRTLWNQAIAELNFPDEVVLP